MSSPDYFQHHQQLLAALYQQCSQSLPFCDDQASDVDREFMESLKSISEASHIDEDLQHRGQNLIARIVAHYPHITPLVNRDLFWFFGGDCLHYMGDDELTLYQRLDELLYETREQLGFTDAKARIFQLH